MSGGAFQHKRFTRPIALGALEVARKKLAADLTVFLAGPFVKNDWTVTELADASQGALLRLEIIKILAQLEHKCVLGEHRGVAEVTADHVPTQSSIALSELALVEDADAIIIIPDSPGSFAELGAWTMREDLCPKTLVLANSAYKDGFGYVSNGVIPMAQNLNAKVSWIDYQHYELAAETIADFLSSIQDRLISRRLRRGR